MPATFLLGRAGTGKTRYCIDALLTELARPGTDPLIFLVPEQASFQMERTLALRAADHGFARAHVLSFSRLAWRVSHELGAPPALLSPYARTMTLRRVIDTLPQVRERLGPTVQTAGFLQCLARLVEEFIREGLTPQALLQAAGALGDVQERERLTALAEAYEGYMHHLGDRQLDPAGHLAWVEAHLDRVPWVREAQVWVDGFAGFTGLEQKLLVRLAQLARRVTISLLLDPQAGFLRDADRPPDPLSLFCPTETTCQRLAGALRRAGVQILPPVVLDAPAGGELGPARAAGIVRLEAGLAAEGSPAGAGGLPGARGADGVRIVECATHAEEVRAAARFIRRSVLESRGGLRFRDFAIIVRDVEPFVHTLEQVLCEYEVPHFIDRRRPLAGHALADLTEALFDAVHQDLSAGSMLGLLRSGLLPLRRRDAEALENIVLAFEPHGMQVWRQSSWRWATQRDRVRGTLPPGVSARRLPRLDAARRRIADALVPLVDLASRGEGARGAEWAIALERTLEALRVRQRLSAWIAAARRQRDWSAAEIHRLAWEALCQVLESLHDVLGATTLHLEELAGLVQSALRDTTLGLAPPTLDQVLVASIERSRHPEIRHAWVMAFNEGIFPARPPDDPLLSATQRELLRQAGLDALSSPTERMHAERLLAYIAFTRPTQGLTISYARRGDDGEERFPSPLLHEVRQILPEVAVQPAEEAPLPTCASDLTALVASPGAAALRDACLHLCRELADDPVYGPAIQALQRGLGYRNRTEPLPAGWCFRVAGAEESVGQARIGAVWECSPTELKVYQECPFRHFASRGLKLQERRGPPGTALDLGTAAHDILSTVVEQAMRRGSVRDLSDEQWLELLDAAVRDKLPADPADPSPLAARTRFLRDVLAGRLRELVLAHADRWRRGSCEPMAVELGFGLDPSGRPPLDIPLGDGRILRLRGSIDRLDVCEREGRRYLLVYDYKSNASEPGALRNRCYLTRERLQLLLYLLAAGQVVDAGPEVVPGGVWIAPLYPDDQVVDEQTARQSAPERSREVRMRAYRPRGLFDYTLVRELDAHLGQGASPVVALRMTRDGRVDGRGSDAVAPAGLQARIELARRTALELARGVLAGRVDVRPLLEGNRLPCGYCAYRPVCRFSSEFNPVGRTSSLPQLDPAAADPAEPGDAS